MKSTGLDPNIVFRKKDLNKVANLVSLGESFMVLGVPGVGKSRFLRHLCYNEKFQDSQNGETAKFFYIDLRKHEKEIIQVLNKEVCAYLSITSSDFSNTVEQLLKKHSLVYIAFDESAILSRYSPSEIGLLKSLRDQYKYKLNFIFAFSEIPKFSYELDALFRSATYNLKLAPLDASDMAATINYIADAYNYVLTPTQKKSIISGARGYPGKARQLILDLVLGNSDSRVNGFPNLDSTLPSLMVKLTKNEFMILKAFSESPMQFLDKTEIAKVISPKSDGIGVSDAAISQLMKRLRVKLTEFNTDFNVKVRRGFGYYIEAL